VGVEQSVRVGARDGRVDAGHEILQNGLHDVIRRKSRHAIGRIEIQKTGRTGLEQLSQAGGFRRFTNPVAAPVPTSGQ
jgi:hypothetical protein